MLLCFDAFGTLFKPKIPIPEQYALVARQLGLNGFSLEQLETSFTAAYKSESKAHPNYGKESGMGAEKWWTNVSPVIPRKVSIRHQVKEMLTLTLTSTRSSTRLSSP